MKNQSSVILGLLLIVVGGILLLDNFNIFPGLPHYLFHWSNIFLVLAVVNAISGNYKGTTVFVGLWGFFILHFFWGWDFRDYWPLIIIIIGLSIILKNKKQKQTASGVKDDYFFDDINIFGGGNKVYTSQQLEGGKITNIFGGGEIDLRQSIPRDGAIIEIFTLFGGCNLLVPADWNISMSTTAIFGGFEDKRGTHVAQNGPTVYLRGITIFGGGDLKSAR